ncbi:amidase domain-containing protein [Bacillus sp. JCM 19034]|uniref:amidase domain-containing protein n=1 Tax=Bacillus sp. JCM 19034 TaxID=1481928 RepID=UPI000AFE24B3|nr:amidase domain-containing protein [Bacillus sp. JCM 19034]
MVFEWSKTGLRGEERERADLLEPGDVIFYDFNGDGRWQHSTIVVAKDANGEPLVNAQTTNSRMRYWKYEDSTAWTSQIQYKFFHILI